LNYVSFIAKRYLFSKSGNNAINIIVKVASFGVMIVSAAFIIVLSGFSGIRTFNLDLIKMTDPELQITPKKGKSFLFNDSLKNILSEDKNIEAYSKVISEKVFINYNDKQRIAKLKGVDSNYFKVIPLENSIFSGDIPEQGTNALLLGLSLANELSFMLSGNQYETINILVPKPGKGFITDPRKAFSNKYFIPVGIYQTTPEHENTYLFSDISAARELLNYKPEQISAIEIKVIKPELIPVVQKKLEEKLGNQFNIKNRKQQNVLIYRMLNTENLMVYFIFALILLLALFNIIGTIMMIIIDKKDDIHTLNVLGLDAKEIKNVFLIQGLSMTVLSGLFGLIVGLILVFIQLRYPFLYVPQTNMAYPVEIHLSNIVWVLLTVLLMGALSTYTAVAGNAFFRHKRVW
jgi:lipoprotein-releasing system permease protein